MTPERHESNTAGLIQDLPGGGSVAQFGGHLFDHLGDLALQGAFAWKVRLWGARGQSDGVQGCAPGAKSPWR